MPRFLAVYTMQPEAVAAFRRMPKAEQDAVDAAGLKAWADWQERTAGAIVNSGGMVGKTRRVTKDGIGDGVNQFCGYLVVEAPDIDAAARLFEGHPHFAIFPGDGVDVMPFLAGPPD